MDSWWSLLCAHGLRGVLRTLGHAAVRAVGVKVRIGDGELCANFLLPRVKFVAELRGALRFLPGEVGLLAQIMGEIEQLHAAILHPFDELPIAAPDGRGGRAALIAVMRVMPE